MHLLLNSFIAADFVLLHHIVIKEKLPGHEEIQEPGENEQEKKRHLNVVFIGHVGEWFQHDQRCSFFISFFALVFSLVIRPFMVML